MEDVYNFSNYRAHHLSLFVTSRFLNRSNLFAKGLFLLSQLSASTPAINSIGGFRAATVVTLIALLIGCNLTAALVSDAKIAISNGCCKSCPLNGSHKSSLKN